MRPQTEHNGAWFTRPFWPPKLAKDHWVQKVGGNYPQSCPLTMRVWDPSSKSWLHATQHTHCRKKSRDEDYDEQQWASSVLVWCTKREKDPNWPKSRVFLSSHNTWSWEASRHCCCFSNECWREYRRSALIFSTMMQADMMMIILLSCCCCCCCCLFKNFSVIFLSINLLTAAAVIAPVWK